MFSPHLSGQLLALRLGRSAQQLQKFHPVSTTTSTFTTHSCNHTFLESNSKLAPRFRPCPLQHQSRANAKTKRSFSYKNPCDFHLHRATTPVTHISKRTFFTFHRSSNKSSNYTTAREGSWREETNRQHRRFFSSLFHPTMAYCCPACDGTNERPQLLRPLKIPDIPDSDDEDANATRALETIKRELRELKQAAGTVHSQQFQQIDELKTCQYHMVEKVVGGLKVGDKTSPKSLSKTLRLNPCLDEKQKQKILPGQDEGPWQVSFYVTVPERKEPEVCDEEGGNPKDGAAAEPSAATGYRIDKQTLKQISLPKMKRQFGIEKSPFENQTFVVDLRFNSTYPELPPCVSFRSTVHHPFLQTEGQVMPLLFYQSLQQMPVVTDRDKDGDTSMEPGIYTLPNILKGVSKFLEDGMGQPSFWKMLDSYPEHMQFVTNINKYTPYRKNSKFFTIKAGDDLPEEWLDERFKKWRDAGYPMEDLPGVDSVNKTLITTHKPDIYSFPMFTMEFCDELVKEVRSIYQSGIEVQRPNSMNRYGVILNYIGMEGLMSAIQRLIQQTEIAVKKFGSVGSSWDAHHSFIVQYAPGKDLGLDMHTDDSDVTCNICLGIDFEGSQVAFCGKMGARDHRKELYIYEQRKGHCLIHLGRQRHGAVDIKKGERMNLIIWNRSRLYRETDEYREQRFVKEEGKPDEVCLSYTHDRDYGVFKRYPNGFEKFKGRGWCPPRMAEYDGFVAEN
ncbi:unnamed protein product [Amoebophrya sp. A120]|nr:unnamed protein product [Amoebophrya sp. A120]|eukprot:GSA120T00010538001.1